MSWSRSGPRATTRTSVSRTPSTPAARCPCVYPPIPIAGRTYVDGGVRSGSNADLAAGCDRVVALSPLDRSMGPLRSARQQLGDLGTDHLVITPDETSRAAIGKNVLDPAARPRSARAGYAQAAAYADQVRRLWG